MADAIPFDIDALAWAKQDGLLPAIVQDADSLRVLMLGYMSRESLGITLASGQVTFFSRSRQRLWTKGESSGNTLQEAIRAVRLFGESAGPALARLVQ